MKKDDYSFKKSFIFVLVLLLYLKIHIFTKKVYQNIKAKIINCPTDQQDKENFLKYFKENISKITNIHEDCEIAIRKIKRLTGTVNSTYQIELLIKWADGLSSLIRIVGKCLTTKATYQRTSSFLKLYGKQILPIRPISYPSERIKAELACSQKMRGTRVRMPDIIFSDIHDGYIFTAFVQGVTVENIVFHISRNQLLEKWHINLFEEIGRGLAEINFKLRIVHGDTATVNWIYVQNDGYLFLTDWETAGKGDPAWDLAHLIYEIAENLENNQQSIVLFDKILQAVIKGYEEIDINRGVINRFPTYWMNHALSISTQTHLRIFQYMKVPIPKEFRFFSRLQSLYVNKNLPAIYNKLILNHLIFRIIRASLSLINILNLITGRTNPNVVIIGSSNKTI